MDINKLTVGEVKEIARLFGRIDEGRAIAAELTTYEPPAHPMVGKHCVIRNTSAGVHIGTVEQASGTEVLLSNARRVWSWKGAFTLSEVALNGISKESRLSVAVPEIYLTQATEMIPTSEEARKRYDAIKPG